MNFKLFSELYEEARDCENVEEFITKKEHLEELSEKQDINTVLLLRFIYDTAHMSIRDIREYLGMTRPKFCEIYEIKIRTMEDWEYGKNPVPKRLLKLLSYTLVESFMS